MIASKIFRKVPVIHRQVFQGIPGRALCVKAKVDLKEQILRQSFTHVPECGWTDESILRGIKDLGLSPLTHTIVDRGAVEIVEHFLKEKNKHVKELFTKSNNESVQIPDNRKSSSETMLYQVLEAHFDYIRYYLSLSHPTYTLTHSYQTTFNYMA